MDDIEKVYSYIKSLKNGRIDIILDNSGFELYADFIFVSFLIDSGYAKQVVLHPKDFGWFVSDVVPNDIESLMEMLSAVQAAEPLKKQWQEWIHNGIIRICTDRFWTTAHPYSRMSLYGKDLISTLQKSDLAIFKGDLNYRKLVMDAMWDRTTPFDVAIGPLAQSGVHILALRTCKADTCVGLASCEQVEALDKETNGKWVTSGKYAVVSYCAGSR